MTQHMTCKHCTHGEHVWVVDDEGVIVCACCGAV